MLKGFIYTLLAIYIFNINIFSQESVKPQIKFLRSLDPCDNDYQFTLVIDVGEIKSEDNFFGFEYSISYDTSKVSYESVGLENTQMIKFSHIYNYNDASKGEAYGSGGVLTSKPLTGTGQLVGLLFDYVDTNFSEVTFTINYLKMTDEYTKEIDLTESNATFYPIVKDKPERLISVSNSFTQLEIDSSLNKLINLDFDIYSDNRLDSFDFELNYNNNILNIDLVQNENYNFEVVNSNTDSKVYRLKSIGNLNKLSSLELIISQNPDYNEENIYKVSYSILDWNRKSCITRKGKDGNFDIKTYQKYTSSVLSEINLDIEIEVFDIFGVKQDYIEKIKDLNKLSNGFYFVRSNNKIEKIIIN